MSRVEESLYFPEMETKKDCSPNLDLNRFLKTKLS